MASKLKTELNLDIIEMSRGISGILDDVAAYCKKCAADSKSHNDFESAETYSKSAKRISKLALKIKQEDE